ncbi:uncharacterized protein BDW47DRAFT_97071 [Aspergillus candidus]|uniref:BTB domain-containing protein n=1 Tax=Aspergillus candidus TaxID=41067 RepID=A0A2I2FP53_ASPCN|nr:hypothetical protein BDW47DRAFT_97071 [Aspergillus candidus]PLB42401.1 hypothetical protein BDW47DRAFT_97071 [Aspergillus candidus]
METPQVQVGAREVSQRPSDATPNTNSADVEMTIAQNPTTETQGETAPNINLTDAPPAEPVANPTEAPAVSQKKPGYHFLDFLTSPIVQLIVGKGENETTLTAHQTLLLESPLLADAVAGFTESGPRRIELPNENVEAFGYFLQFQYTRDYSADSPTEQDAAAAGKDHNGEQLLKHARVYTLAEKLGIPSLKTLAHSKIHRISSTPLGEITYARYVYTNTPAEDATIRKPVAMFWAHRSHVLRHEAEGEFKKLCLEVPEFCFDVLSLVLDQKEKRALDRAETEGGVRGSGRKRLRSGI